MENLITDLEMIESNSEQCEITNISPNKNTGKKRKLYIESYGCQMNLSDSEIVIAIMTESGFDTTSQFNEADVIFLNTCSIRKKAEQTIRNRLNRFNGIKKQKPELIIGILGCMAERLKNKLLEEEKIVDLVVGPDAYRDLSKLVEKVDQGHRAVNTLLSREETYADISPIRLNSNGVTAFISIMRGCDNMCSFCVVPFTRGRERSRDIHSIVKEAKQLFENGYREITLLGQNVDSYLWSPNSELKGKAKIKRSGSEDAVNFAQLLALIAEVDPNLRIRFSTSHPKDITDEVLLTIKKYENVCNYIHLPVQSGNSRVLKLMNRTYDRDWYLGRITAIRNILGEECGISSDFIAGFCTETDDDHKDTLSIIDEVQFDFSYMFYYSERPGTLAAKKYKDDVPLKIKKERLSEIITRQQTISLERNKQALFKYHKVLIEGESRKSNEYLQGRNSENKVVVFPKGNYKKGDYVNVLVEDCTAATLMGNSAKKIS